jgi:hypothetical protein
MSNGREFNDGDDFEGTEKDAFLWNGARGVTADDESRRKAAQNMAISVHLSLNEALNALPSPWLEAACQAHQLDQHSRGAKLRALAGALTNPDALRRCVSQLPLRARRALKRVMDNGGWMRLAELTKEFGRMDGDGWFWDQQPPKSCLGGLCRCALLFVGRGLVDAGSRRKRWLKVAVIPAELRAPLQRALAELIPEGNDDVPAMGDDALSDALFLARLYYDEASEKPLLSFEDVVDFLHQAHRQGRNLLSTWAGIEAFLNFTSQFAYEITSLDDLCGYHIGELARDYLDLAPSRLGSMAERRRVIRLVRVLYDFLLDRGKILPETCKFVRQSCARLIQDGLNAIRRPAPVGGEVILCWINPDTNSEERYTVNHQRLLMAWQHDFDRDWPSLLAHCHKVPSGARKADLARELAAADPVIYDLLIGDADKEELQRALRWFYEEQMLEISVW